MSEPPADSELLALIALEKEALVDPGPSRARLASRLASELADPPSPPAGAAKPVALARAPWKGAALRGLGVFGAGILVGVGVDRARTSPPPAEVRYVDRVVEAVRTVDAGGALAPSVVPAEASVATSAPDRGARPPAPRSAAAPLGDTLAQERQLVDVARSALARGDANAALAAVDEHAKTFPRGQLTEMREALAVQALVRADRGPEARTRAAQFRRRFPASVYAPVVDGAILSLPSIP